MMIKIIAVVLSLCIMSGCSQQQKIMRDNITRLENKIESLEESLEEEKNQHEEEKNQHEKEKKGLEEHKYVKKDDAYYTETYCDGIYEQLRGDRRWWFPWIGKYAFQNIRNGFGLSHPEVSAFIAIINVFSSGLSLYSHLFASDNNLLERNPIERDKVSIDLITLTTNLLTLLNYTLSNFAQIEGSKVVKDENGELKLNSEIFEYLSKEHKKCDNKFHPSKTAFKRNLEYSINVITPIATGTYLGYVCFTHRYPHRIPYINTVFKSSTYVLAIALGVTKAIDFYS